MPDVPLPSLLNPMKLEIILLANAEPVIRMPPPLLLVCGGGATRSTGGPALRLLGPIRLFWMRWLFARLLIEIPGPEEPAPLLEMMFWSAILGPPIVLLLDRPPRLTPPVMFASWTEPTTLVPILLFVILSNWGVESSLPISIPKTRLPEITLPDTILNLGFPGRDGPAPTAPRSMP